MSGPLQGLKVVEVAGLGPAPFAVMMMADMGADVIRLERASGGTAPGSWNLTSRGRPSVAIDLKHPDAVELTLSLCEQADVLIEGFRPGVMERLGLGPDVVLSRNPRLVFGRMTGYGQDGPLSSVAGHDINYISIAGALGEMQRHGEKPMFPLNLVGDYGGGGMFLAFGVLAAIYEAQQSGKGQVVDAAMVEGTAVLTTIVHALRHAGLWVDDPGSNWLNAGAPWYEVYETADGKYFSVGAIEPQFYAKLLDLLELAPDDFPQYDIPRWPEFKQRFAEVFKSKTRAEWTEVLAPVDACAAPVLGITDALSHPHNVARQVFVEHEGAIQPAPAPRFSRTPAVLGLPPREAGADTDSALTAWGISSNELTRLRSARAIA